MNILNVLSAIWLLFQCIHSAAGSDTAFFEQDEEALIDEGVRKLMELGSLYNVQETVNNIKQNFDKAVINEDDDISNLKEYEASLFSNSDITLNSNQEHRTNSGSNGYVSPPFSNLQSSSRNASSRRQVSDEDLDATRHFLEMQNLEDDEMVAEEMFIPVASHPEDSLALSRSKRQLSPGSGEEVLQTQVTLQGTPTTAQLTPGSAENLALRAELAEAIRVYLASYYPGETFVVEVTLISAGSIIANADILYNTETLTIIDLAQAYEDLTSLRGTVTIYVVLEEAIAPSTGADLLPAICYLCVQPQTCQSRPLPDTTIDWFCATTSAFYYPFGVVQGDSSLPRNIEFQTIVLNVETGFPYLTDFVFDVHISVNGIISFDQAYSSFNPAPLPVPGVKLLAPFWADLDLSDTDDKSNVYYQLYTKSPTNTATQLAVINKANADVVSQINGVASFDATYVIVVTFEAVPPWQAQSVSSERVHFQVVIITNGQSTYVSYVYAQGGMQFLPSSNRAVEIGWGSVNFGTRSQYYNFDTVIGNTNLPGYWFFQIGEESNSRALCRAWFQSNIQIFRAISILNVIVPPCPCNRGIAESNFFWVRSFEQQNCYDILPIFGPYGRRCCYRSDGSPAFENRIPTAGSFQLSTPYFGDLVTHDAQDVVPKRWCCEESDFCDLYYGVRPISPCISTRRSRRSFGWGDPHIKTIDGKDYIFNGLGEYVMIKIQGDFPIQREVNGTSQDTTQNVNFELQGRTCQSVTASGNLTTATQWCALAGRMTDSRTFRVRLIPLDDTNVNNPYLEIYVNGTDYSARFRDDEEFSYVLSGIYMRRDNKTLTIRTPDRVGIDVRIAGEVIELSFEIDDNLQNLAEGLFGNYNGDAEDDYAFRNGTRLSPNATDAQLFEMGQTWAITSDESLFVYEFGKNTSSYSNPDFKPLFLDEVASDVRAEAEGVCGGTANIACVFDYIATQNQQLALESGVAIVAFDEQQESQANSVPNITQVAINSIVGKATKFNITAVDNEDDNVRYIVLDAPPSGQLTYTNDSGVFEATFIPSSVETVSISVVAQDSKGLQSEVSTVTIANCPDCLNGGECNYNDTDFTDGLYYSVSPCKCLLPYSGDRCENDKDGCVNSPCPAGTTCTDIAAEDEIALGRDHNCSTCPSGYELNSDLTKCLDIDECATNTSDCNGNAECINDIGSFKCICNSGYRKSVETGRCADINECVENNHQCAQICENVDGGFNCSCYDGFTPTGNLGRNCSKIESVDPCAQLTGGNCSYGCRNNSGVAECFCESGFELDSDGRSCKNVDECKSNICSQKCTDTEGSYACSCHAGFSLNTDLISCDPCPDGTYGNNCANKCECRGRAISCDSVKGCICALQWTGEMCLQDVDECLAENICPVEQRCVNTNGSYECSCPVGYEDVNNNGSCTDIDECKNPSVHKCPQACVNNPGSFFCECTSGYNYNENTVECQDIDECDLRISGCLHKCVNTDGSFNCLCEPGYALSEDRKSCYLDTNLCANKPEQCQQDCTNVDGNAKCFCRLGFFLGTDELSCFDVNECNTTLNTCSDYCNNIEGTYTCTCPPGKKLQNDLRSCIACDEYHWGQDCLNDCACNPLGSDRCNPETGCICKLGWTGDKCQTDKNECVATTFPCPLNSVCINTAGSFSCQCRPGFQLNSTNQCEDIDECLSTPCDHDCDNAVGSYTCSCFSGFLKDGDKCNDIDECGSTQTNGCNQLCRNTQGSYACECLDGFLLNTTSRRTCYADSAKTACQTDNTCDTACRVVNGQDVCFCNVGFELDAVNTSLCVDTDECVGTNPCTSGTCNNNDGGFQCSCEDGFRLAADKVTCLACDEGTYGNECSSNCTCDALNTLKCLANNGTCQCKDGYDDPNCSTDIDECSTGQANCQANSNCNNLPGSYQCVCDKGYISSGGVCSPCSSTTYGIDCLNVCTCEESNTDDCNDTTGVCTCKPEWTGGNCTQDVNECDNSDICIGSNERCDNIPGSFACVCNAGYTRISSVCVDINECLTINNVCNDNQTCVNTDGSYTCNCADGFSLSNNQCTDIDECQTGASNCSSIQVCRNTIPNYACDCITGYKETNGQCQDIDECQENSDDCSAPRVCSNSVPGFTCVCGTGFEENTNGVCIDTIAYHEVNLDLQIGGLSANTFIPGTTEYNNFTNAIAAAVERIGLDTIGNALLGIRVKSFRSDDEVAEIEIQINEQNSNNSDVDAALIIEALTNIQTLNISDAYQAAPLQSVSIGNVQVGASTSVCTIFEQLTSCGSGTECRVINGKPSCQAVNDDDNYELVLGLGIGIPVFFLLVIIIAVMVYVCVRKQKNRAERGSTPSVDRDAPFRSIFATQMATKSSLASPHRFSMYSPDAYSEAGTSESSGNGQLLKSKQKVRSDFQDSPWYDNRGATPRDPAESQGAPTEAGAGPTSNFSWEYMFRLLEPHRGFEIQRPNLSPVPNPTYTPRGSKKPDSPA